MKLVEKKELIEFQIKFFNLYLFDCDRRLFIINTISSIVFCN
jgi:hypothetical protein